MEALGVHVEPWVFDAKRGIGEIESREEQEQSAAFGNVAQEVDVGELNEAHGSAFLRGRLFGLRRGKNLEK